MAQPDKINTFFGWLGRQVGHVTTAVKTDVSKPEPKVVYRNDKVEEKAVPNQPGVKLRRTTIDEVIVERRLNDETRPNPSDLRADK
jgi:hypothetical protein